MQVFPATNDHETGTLTIVGTGIRVISEVTLEARALMEGADKLLYLVADPVTESWITKLNSTAETLQGFYAEGKDRQQTYLEMVDRIMSCLFGGGNVVVALYGHPGVFVYPSHEAIKRARLAGHKARMLPGISAEDCLFADLGIDPADNGCRSYEASEFLLCSRQVDVTTSLILWQIGAIGELGYRTDRMFNQQGLEVLIEVLSHSYGLDHEVTVYEANQYQVCEPIIHNTPLRHLCSAGISPISTLYVPALRKPPFDQDMAARLGIALLNPTGT